MLTLYIVLFHFDAICAAYLVHKKRYGWATFAALMGLHSLVSATVLAMGGSF